MLQLSPDITAILLARGFTEVHDRLTTDGSVVQQDATMPPRLRQGLSMLSGLCLSAGVADLGASVHVAMALACEPFSAWGIPAFDIPFCYTDVALID